MSSINRVEPQVRDLREILESPALLDSGDSRFKDLIVPDGWGLEQLEKHREALHQLEIHPEPLLEFLRSTVADNRLLGRYFEALLQFWVRHFLRPDLLLSRVALKRDRRTIGEFDLVYEIGKQGFHLEASVKFYLLVQEEGRRQETPTFSDFVGTFTQDRLDRKVRALFERQLRLSESREGRDLLSMAGFSLPLSARAFFKGTLFYPSSDWEVHPAPVGVAPGHRRGWWTRASSLLFPETPRASWAVLPRQRWLSSSHRPDEIAFLGDEADARRYCLEHFGAHRVSKHQAPALMLAALCRDRATDGLWSEVSRGVVVSEEWPEQALRDRQTADRL